MVLIPLNLEWFALMPKIVRTTAALQIMSNAMTLTSSLRLPSLHLIHSLLSEMKM